MPTKKPRVNLTLTEEQYAVLRRLASLSGVSMSSLVVEYLEVAMPSLEALADNLEALTNANDEIKQNMRDSLDLAIARVQVLQHYVNSEVNNLGKSLDGD